MYGVESWSTASLGECMTFCCTVEGHARMTWGQPTRRRGVMHTIPALDIFAHSRLYVTSFIRPHRTLALTPEPRLSLLWN